MSVSEEERKRHELEPQIEPQISLPLLRVLVHAINEASGSARTIDLDSLHSAFDAENPAGDISDESLGNLIRASLLKARILGWSENLLEHPDLFSSASPTEEVKEAIGIALTLAREAGSTVVTKTHLLTALNMLEEREDMEVNLALILQDPQVHTGIKNNLMRAVNRAIQEAQEDNKKLTISQLQP